MTSPTSEQPDYTAMGLAAASEINALRDNVARLGQHSLALNQMCYSLANYLGDTADGDPVEVVPMELLRRIFAMVEMFEAKLIAVREAVGGPHLNCDSVPADALKADGCFVSAALVKVKAVLDA